MFYTNIFSVPLPVPEQHSLKPVLYSFIVSVLFLVIIFFYHTHWTLLTIVFCSSCIIFRGHYFSAAIIDFILCNAGQVRFYMLTLAICFAMQEQVQKKCWTVKTSRGWKVWLAKCLVWEGLVCVCVWLTDSVCVCVCMCVCVYVYCLLSMYHVCGLLVLLSCFLLNVFLHNCDVNVMFIVL